MSISTQFPEQKGTGDSMNENYIALIPAYKPGPFLLELAQKLWDNGFYVVVVDDGSGPQYEKLFFECSRYAEVLHHNQNSGKGRALKTGLSYIVRCVDPKTVVVTMDADGQHRVEDAMAICQIASQKQNTLILGSRKLDKKVPLRSRFGNSLTRLVYGLSTGVKVYDTQTGLRAFRCKLIPRLLDIPGERYEYEMNVLLRLARSRIRILEHWIETIYIDGNASSHFDAVKDSLRIYKEILKFSASSIISFLVDYAFYSLLFLLSQNLWLSNIVARVISASVNFTLNRKFVFKSRETLFAAALKYFLLAAGILLGNTLILGFFVNVCGIHQMLAKLLTEIIFFVLSWLMQRLVVFRKQTGGKCQ